MEPHISIKGETIFEIAHFPVTNSLITTFFVIVIFYFIARYYYTQIYKEDRSLTFYALHTFIVGLYNMFKSVLGEKTKAFYTLLASFFFFILLNNWSGLIPGVGSLLIEPQTHAVETEEELHVEEQPVVTTEEHAEEAAAEEHHYVPLFRGGTADLNTTIALAVISVFVTQLYGFRYLGPKKHLNKYFDARDPMMYFLGPLEVIQEFARIISFAFRLYGNIFAGEVLLTIIPFLLPIFLSFFVTPMFFMEIFVGVVQALVFAMLSAVFIKMAISTHH